LHFDDLIGEYRYEDVYNSTKKERNRKNDRHHHQPEDWGVLSVAELNFKKFVFSRAEIQ
jgi:hypothetical protein